MIEYPGKINDEYIKEYVEKLVPKETDELIYEMEQYASENNVPIVEIEVKKMLEVLVKMSNVKSILEVGTAIGYSGIVFSKAMNFEGYLKSFEINEDIHNIAKENIKKYEEQSGKRLNVDLVLADAKDSLEAEEGIYDMVFIDAAKGHYRTFYEQIKSNVKEGSVIISDNILFKGMIATDKYVIRRKKTIVKRMRQYLDFLMNHPQLVTTVIPIGDGVAISYVKGELNE